MSPVWSCFNSAGAGVNLLREAVCSRGGAVNSRRGGLDSCGDTTGHSRLVHHQDGPQMCEDLQS